MAHAPLYSFSAGLRAEQGVARPWDNGGEDINTVRDPGRDPHHARFYYSRTNERDIPTNESIECDVTLQSVTYSIYIGIRDECDSPDCDVTLPRRDVTALRHALKA